MSTNSKPNDLNTIKDLRNQQASSEAIINKNNLAFFPLDYKEKRSKYIKEQATWKAKINEKRKQISQLKGIIKNLEIHSTTLIAIFAIAIVFCLVSLFILTPLSVLGLAIRATHLMWGLGIGSGLLGVAIGIAAIRSSVALHKNKTALEKINLEREHFKLLISKRDTISTFLNYEKLNEWNLIKITPYEHLKIIQANLWHHPLFVGHLEDLEQAEQYEKNGLAFPKELQKKIQENFTQY